ncbi:MAG: SEC-C domain-containing protein, partial [Planctomycetaceae bacterium]|nr:SEC-C domain-containing protein [Planctomycetaceae bacterium]
RREEWLLPSPSTVGVADGDSFDEPPATPTIFRDEPKTGRNDPCPCGSGKKYKKCCLKKQSEFA